MTPLKRKPIRAVVIGASAGAFDALQRVLSALPATFKPPTIAVVHIPPDKESSLPRLLQDRCGRPMREACDKEPLEPGVVYFAPPDYHLLVEKEELLSLSSEEPVLFSRPSIDVLFESAADCYGEGLAGVILSGGNADGAMGLRAVLDCGGLGLVQSPDTAHASAMPEAALAACPEALSLSLADIARFLQNHSVP